MADVSLPSVGGSDGGRRGVDGRRDRAQLILITGLTLAVTFVAVVVLLNTVIYTENLATRGVDAGGEEAVEFRDAAASDVGAIVDRENRNPNTTRADAAATVGNYSELVADHRLRGGAVADVAVADRVDGLYVAQDGERNFTSRTSPTGSPAADWTVATNVTATRGYAMTAEPTVTVDEADVETDAFAVRTTDGTATWTLYVYRTGAMAADETGVRVARNGTTTLDGTVAAANVTLDLTGGTVAEDDSVTFRWANGTEDGSEYAVAYANGDAARGTYDLTVDDEGTVDAAPDYYGDRSDATTEPYALDAVYAVTLDVEHRTPDLRYADRIRVAPGERDD